MERKQEQERKQERKAQVCSAEISSSENVYKQIFGIIQFGYTNSPWGGPLRPSLYLQNIIQLCYFATVELHCIKLCKEQFVLGDCTNIEVILHDCIHPIFLDQDYMNCYAQA